LASVRSLIESDPSTAATTIELLVDYLRATIPRLRESELDSTLGQQLEICESYLRLMCVRMGRLGYRIEVGQELRARSFPSLLLITLVENALKHGIEPKVGPGMVVVSAALEEGRLRVHVIDDGVGLRDSCGSGIGLNNVREQLHARYGEHAKFTLSGAARGGACATIEIADR
ncbi:MAG TPA: ATP-binding protein, partial [Polyangiales bacterium]